MAVTIYDVAKKAGVGIGTVSRALNNSPRILPVTKARVLQIAKELNYKPHALAQSLARKKSKTIAVIVPFFMTYFFVEMLKGIQHALTQLHYDLILYSIDKRSKMNLFLSRTLEEKRVDGVILCSLQISDAYAKKFLTTGLPLVLLDTFHPLLDSITIENEDGAYRATRRLIEIGHTQIGMINACLTSRPAHLRFQGFQRALLESQLECHPEYVIVGEQEDESDGFNREVGYQAMQKLIALNHHRPSAVFIASDIQAIGAIQALEQQHLKVPEDLAIISFDDIELADLFGLTTMHQPIYKMGQSAVHRLVAKILGSTEKCEITKIQPSLIIRKSCGGSRILSPYLSMAAN